MYLQVPVYLELARMRVVAAPRQGFLLPDYDVGFDVAGAHEAASHLFVSHAHADHVPKTNALSVYATEATAALMRARGFRGAVTALAFGTPLALPRARVTLLPAGHILGSALIHVETADGILLYSGDYRTPPSPITTGCELPARVDQFITEATFGLPLYRWPDHAVLFERLRAVAEEALAEQRTPIFLAYNLGKAQEILHALAPLQRPVQIHEAGYRLCQVYEQFGVDLGLYQAYDRTRAAGQILVMPARDYRSMGRLLGAAVRVAYCSGWAALEARRTQLAVDDLIPLSDHLDFFELLEVCRRLAPRKVWITHAPNPQVLQYYLAEMGLESACLHPSRDT